MRRTSSTSSSSFSIFMQHFSLERSFLEAFFFRLFFSRVSCDDNMFRCCKMMPNEFLCLLPIARLSRNFSHFFSLCSLSAVSRLNFHRQIVRKWMTFLENRFCHFIYTESCECVMKTGDFFHLLFFAAPADDDDDNVVVVTLPQVAYPSDDNVKHRQASLVVGVWIRKMRKSITIIDSREMLRIAISSFSVCWNWLSSLLPSFQMRFNGVRMMLGCLIAIWVLWCVCLEIRVLEDALCLCQSLLAGFWNEKGKKN